MTRMKTFKISLKWLTGLSVVILLVTLYFGLRPKDFDFSNNVKGNRHILYFLCQAFILCINYNYLNTLPANKYTTPVSIRLKISADALANK